MATRDEHYRTAERLLDEARQMALNVTAEQQANLLLAAQVHATLATVEVSRSVRDS